jgi:hypothetical protein
VGCRENARQEKRALIVKGNGTILSMAYVSGGGNRRPCTFRARELTAAVKASKAAGVEIAGVEVTKDGTIKVIAGKSAELMTAPDAARKNEWDEVL